MVLTVNIGNTRITVGGYTDGIQRFCGQICSDPLATGDEYAIRLRELLSLFGEVPEAIDGAILGSVVPMLTERLLAALRLLTPVRALTVGPGLKSGLRLRIDSPAQLGADLLCGVVAALQRAENAPVVVISADTAMTMMAANAARELVGGAILPGPQLSLSSLVQRTAQLPQIDLAAAAPASVLGKNTEACLQSGIILGTASLLDGMAARFYAELGSDVQFFATGSLSPAILHACTTPIQYCDTLISDGLYAIWQRNRKG